MLMISFRHHFDGALIATLQSLPDAARHCPVSYYEMPTLIFSADSHYFFRSFIRLYFTYFHFFIARGFHIIDIYLPLLILRLLRLNAAADYAPPFSTLPATRR